MKTALLLVLALALRAEAAVSTVDGKVAPTTGLSLSSAAATYVNKAGDTMTGGLTVTSVTVNGTTLVTSGGKVGIGTTAPARKLDVSVTGAENEQAIFRNAGTYHTGIAFTTTTNHLSDTSAWGIYGGPNDYLTGLANRVGFVLPTGIVDFSIVTGATNLNTSNGTAKFTVLQNGNVGIGTASPSEKLEVSNGNIKTNYGIIAATATFTSSVTVQGSAFTIKNGIVAIKEPTQIADSQVPIQTSAGGVAGWYGVNRTNGAYGALFGWQSALGGAAVRSVNVSDDLSFVVANTVRALTMRPSGNVGIMTTTPATVLDVNGNAQFGSTAKSTFSTNGSLTMAENSDITITGSSGKLSVFGESEFNTNGNDAQGIRIGPTGNSGSIRYHADGSQRILSRSGFPLILNTTGDKVGIGTASPGAKLHVVGDAAFTSGITASSVTSLGGIRGTAVQVGTSLDAVSEEIEIDSANPLINFQTGDVPTAYVGAAAAAFSGGAATSLGLRGESSVQLGVGGTVGATLTSTGVGIGTTAPATKLHMSSGVLTVDGAGAGIVADLPAIGANTGQLVLKKADGALTTDGTTLTWDSANDAMSVNGLFINQNTVRVAASGTLQINSANGNGIIAIAPSAAEKVGIGTTSPATTLDVNGNAQFGTTAKSTFSTNGSLTMPSVATLTIGTMTFSGAISPPNGQALCFSAGAIGHCTSAVGITGDCTCVAP